MTPRDVFGLVIRTFGLLGTFYWLFLLFSALAGADASLFFMAFIVSAISGYLLKGAPVLLEFCYPSSRESRWTEGHARVSEGGERVA
jgi:hypothetical protein